MKSLTTALELYRNNLKNRFLTALAFPQNSRPYSSLVSRQSSFAPYKNSQPCHIPDSSSDFGVDGFFSSLRRSPIFSLLQMLCASLFIGLCAQISIPLYFTPVPLTGQTFAIILIASTLSRHKAVLATVLYLIEGSLGLPVWAGGSFGVHCLFGPTGGYLLSYPLQAYLISYYIEKQKSMRFLKTMIAIVASCCIQMGIGTLWLSRFVGTDHALMMGFYPFLPGEILKSLIVATYIKTRQGGQK